MELPEPIARFVDRARQTAERVGMAVQRVVLNVLLTLLYLVGVGLTKLMAMVAARPMLRLYDGPDGAPSYWKDAEGYGPDRDALHKQF